ncbi:MAG: HD domain-containing protein [Spirochaetaceae bacterium]|nr:MAG: HD domain-containing protein [Spirochaetaceae bacterium]
MNAIQTGTIPTGKYFSRPVFLDESFILLSPETPMTDELKIRLEKWGFTTVRSAGELLDAPPVGTIDNEAPLVALDKDLRDAETLKEAQAFYEDTADFLEAVFSDFTANNTLQPRAVSERVKQLAEEVRTKKKYMLRFSSTIKDGRNYIVDHSTRTAILAIAVGGSLKLPPHRLIELGNTALLHEIGMVRLPPQVYLSNRPLSDPEKKAITAHTLLGFKILREYSFPMPVCLGVLEAKENVDGSGYPRGLSGEKISLYGKIVSVCAAYAAITATRPYRPARNGHSGIMELLGQHKQRYDETVLRALVFTLSIFPIGTYVQLTNGACGIVVDTNPENLRRPFVRVIRQANGLKSSEQPVVNTSSDEWQIKGTVTAEELGITT